MVKRLTAVLGILAGLAVLAAACGGGGEKEEVKGTPAPGAPAVAVEEKEWALQPDKPSAAPGKVTFQVKNVGKVEHEFVVLQTDLAADALKVRGDKVDEKASGTVIGEIEEDKLKPGKQVSATFELKPGKYVLFCNVPGHYQKGVRSAFEVK